MRGQPANCSAYCLLSLAASLLVSACASSPEFRSSSGRATSGEPFSIEGTYLENRLRQGRISVGQNGPGRWTWEGTTSEGYNPYRGTVRWGDGRVFVGTVYIDPTTATVVPNEGRDTLPNGCVYEGRYYDGKYSKGKLSCPESTLEGEFHENVFRRGTVTTPDGRKQREDRNQDGKRLGPATLDYPNGDRDQLIYREGVLVLQLPEIRKLAPLPPCPGLPKGWQLMKGNCVDGKPEGEVQFWNAAQRQRILATYKDGQPAGTATLEWITQGNWPSARSINGTMNSQFQFSEGLLREAGTDSARTKRVWYWDWIGPFVNNQPHGQGKCAYKGKEEPCEMVAGKRVDAVQVERDRLNAIASARVDAEIAANEERRRAEQERKQAAKERERQAALARQDQALEDMRRAAARSGPSVFSPEASAKTAREFQAMADNNARMLAQAEAAKQQLARDNAAQQRTNDDATRRAAEARGQAERQAAERQAAERTRLAQAQAQEQARERQEAERQAAARREEERRASERTTQAQQAKPGVTVPEAVAVCRRNEQDYWFCDGPVQKTSVGDQGEAGLRRQLGLSGCPNPRSERASPDGQGKLFLCGTGVKPGARDVAKLRGFVTARLTYRCEGSGCSALSDSREITQ